MSDVDIALIKQEVLSLLVSAKNGLNEQELLKDYRSFNSNKELPYKELGYSSLISLLRTWPDVCRIQQGNNGLVRFLAVAEDSIKHILSLVKGQRQSKSQRRGRRSGGRGGGISRGDTRSSRGARFSQTTTYTYINRPRGSNRGAFNGRTMHNVNQTERHPVQFRSNMGQSNPNLRTKSNISAQVQYVTQQQANRFTVPNVPEFRTTSNELQQQENTIFTSDRRVIDSSKTLRITVANSKTKNYAENINEEFNKYQEPTDASSTYFHGLINECGEQYEEQDCKEEEVISNIQTLLNEYPHGIRLLALEDLYKNKFGRNILTELNISNVLLLQDFVDDFATISRHGEENGSCDHIITLKDLQQVAQTTAHLLKQIFDSGIVPRTFRYATNLVSYINDSRFQAYVSDISTTEHCFHIQPLRYQEHIETLMEEINSFYSSPMSNSLVVNQIETGLVCVTTYDGVYHRAFIQETDLYRCVIVYVDYGTTREVDKTEQDFKYLLNHFAQLPAMCISCRLDDVSFIPDDSNLLSDTFNELYTLCKDGPYFIEPTGYMNDLLTIRILDADGQCLNDIVVQMNLAAKLSSGTEHWTAINNLQQDIERTTQLQTVTPDTLSNAVRCPLPDSGLTTPETAEEKDNFRPLENNTCQIQANDIDIAHKCKIVQIDANKSLFLIRRNEDNKPYIPCFNFAQLLNWSESDILNETLLSRIRLKETPEYSAVFDFIRLTYSKDCVHIHQRFIFLFDLRSAEKYIQQLNLDSNSIILDAVHQQLNDCKESQYWDNCYHFYVSSCAHSSYESKMKRYNDLLNRRRTILCNLLHTTTDVNQDTHELTSIESELEQLVLKMHVDTPLQQTGGVRLAPPNSTRSVHKDIDSQPSKMNQSDKLRDLMERCKTLINAILIFDDFIPIDDRIIEYIENNLPFLNLKKNSLSDEQLYTQYFELQQNLTCIVDDLQEKLSASMKSSPNRSFI